MPLWPAVKKVIEHLGPLECALAKYRKISSTYKSLQMLVLCQHPFELASDMNNGLVCLDDPMPHIQAKKRTRWSNGKTCMSTRLLPVYASIFWCCWTADRMHTLISANSDHKRHCFLQRIGTCNVLGMLDKAAHDTMLLPNCWDTSCRRTFIGCCTLSMA